MSREQELEAEIARLRGMLNLDTSAGLLRARIRYVMHQRNIKQIDLCEPMKVDGSRISKILSAPDWKLSVILELQDVLGFPLFEVASSEVPPLD